MELVAQRKARYRRGTRVRLVRFTADEPIDDNQVVPQGTCGTVISVDDLGTVHTLWDNGSTLGLAVGDQFDLL
ncbi:DUF4314 domain-containing protein [Hamadaea sp. NPDC050747]|uniref:DUF4314 domain-containing protein n=1 Tax=Hamadaea sp. NPDC050747 TaxID=3155789 RepID=UPI0034099015